VLCAHVRCNRWLICLMMMRSIALCIREMTGDCFMHVLVWVFGCAWTWVWNRAHPTHVY